LLALRSARREAARQVYSYERLYFRPDSSTLRCCWIYAFNFALELWVGQREEKSEFHIPVMLHSQDLKLSDNHELASAAEGGQLSAALLIDDEIVRYGMEWRADGQAAILKFAPEIEHRFEADTRVVRTRELQLTMSFGLGFYLLTSVTDFIFVPDLVVAAHVAKAFNLPLLLIPILFGSKLSVRAREMVVVLVAITAITSLATIAAMSSAPLAPFAFMTATLALIYANTTFPLPFKYAVVCSAACCGTMAVEIYFHRGIDTALSQMLLFQTMVGSSFSLITSYRIERSTRLNYLLSSREGLRLRMLAAERERLTALSNTDALTGLVNRRHFDRESAAALSSSTNAGKDVALLFIDVDHFKRYNDHYGHHAGDGCLRAVASAISEALRGTDTMAARYGGEEFAILLLDVTQAESQLIADRVCRSVSARRLQHLNRKDSLNLVTISVGVACGSIDDGITLDGLIESADIALYAAKRGGRNRVQFNAARAAA
jgi:diguanylate cyclase (GGDEF)-like protein